MAEERASQDARVSPETVFSALQAVGAGMREERRHVAVQLQSRAEKVAVQRLRRKGAEEERGR